MNIPKGWLELLVSVPIADPDTPIVTFCGANIRRPLSAKTSTELGYANVRNYKDAYPGWVGADEPIEIDPAWRSMRYRLQEVTTGDGR